MPPIVGDSNGADRPVGKGAVALAGTVERGIGRGPGGPPADSRREAALRAVLGASTLAMIALSWPLWAGRGGAFPRVPFVLGLPEPPWWRASLAVALAASIALGAVRREALLAGLAPLALLLAGDQHRFQPWIYQYSLMALALGAMPAGRAAGPCRLLLVALYLHSGLSKLDATFAREIGAAFLQRATSPLGLEPPSWPGPMRVAATMAMPLAELLVGLGLLGRRTRPIALAGAVLMHAALIGMLGPWGLDHSAIVVLWNASLMIEGIVLFARTGGRPIPGPAPSTLRAAPVWAAFGLAIALPFLERWGLWDSWPSFALYASHAERAYVWLHEDGLGRYPEAVRRHAEASAPGDPWHRLDLTAWSRDERGTPPYPQARAAVGVAEALAEFPGGGTPVRVAAWGRASRFSGRRTRAEAVGATAIRRLADGYAINAHPSPRARSD